MTESDLELELLYLLAEPNSEDDDDVPVELSAPVPLRYCQLPDTSL